MSYIMYAGKRRKYESKLGKINRIKSGKGKHKESIFEILISKMSPNKRGEKSQKK